MSPRGRPPAIAALRARIKKEKKKKKGGMKRFGLDPGDHEEEESDRKKKFAHRDDVSGKDCLP